MPRTVKPGCVIVHNMVNPVHSEQAPGVNGFRVWTQEEDRSLVVCKCGWASHLPVHYKPNLALVNGGQDVSTHHVVVWVGTKKGETDLFTNTARNSVNVSAKMRKTEEQVAAAKFVEHLRETGLTKPQAEARKKTLKAEYRKNGYRLQTRQPHPQAMK